MRHLTSLLILSSLIFTLSLCYAKPVFGPIGVAEKHKIVKMLENEQKSLQMLEEEQALLERVVETLSKEIEDKEAHIEKLRSFTRGRGAVVADIYDDYRTNYKIVSNARPGR
ncbi:unnamed protein product [Caenorhabditis sp. 36 PRJEB53466]|nr:unnamed protein product [Caenorhabditis sp. 36 PRJEB53466]